MVYYWTKVVIYLFTCVWFEIDIFSFIITCIQIFVVILTLYIGLHFIAPTILVRPLRYILGASVFSLSIKNEHINHGNCVGLWCYNYVAKWYLLIKVNCLCEINDLQSNIYCDFTAVWNNSVWIWKQKRGYKYILAETIPENVNLSITWINESYCWNEKCWTGPNGRVLVRLGQSYLTFR